VLRKDADSEKAGLTRIKKANQRKHGGKAATEQHRENNTYSMVATSVGKEASAAQILELYRLRWQIEIAFKRLKSLFGYNDLPSLS
jgi:IS4 transposase